MRTLKHFSIAMMMTGLVQASVAQTIRIADNNANRPGGTNVYATIALAVAAAVPGDIVYVQPSLTTYGDVTIDRPITLRGIGFNTGKDLAYQSIVGNINLTNKSDNTANASGTIIEGVIAGDIYLGTKTGSFTYTIQNVTVSNAQISRIYRDPNYMTAQNVTIKNCWIGTLQFLTTNITQLLVYGNFMNGANYSCSSYQAMNFGPGSMSNCIISNNIFQQTADMGFYGVAISGVIVTNNNFLGGNNIAGSKLNYNRVASVGVNCNTSGAGITDVVFTNNIFFGCAPIGTVNLFERNIFTNNLSFGTSNDALPPAGTGSGNTGAGNKVAQDPLFVNAPYNTAYAATMDFRLQASSPAKNAGSDGTDMGITGGAYPFTGGNFVLKPSSAPVITTFNPAAMVPQNQPVKTNIKAKSN